MANELLTADELAGRLKLTPDTVRQWARRGLIPSIKPTPKVLRFNLTSVIETLSDGPANRGRTNG